MASYRLPLFWPPSALSRAASGIDLVSGVARGAKWYCRYAGGGRALRSALKTQRLGWRVILLLAGMVMIKLPGDDRCRSGSDSRINPAPELSAYRESR